MITLICRRMPFSYYIVGAVIQIILVVGVRFTYRFYTQIIVKKSDVPEVPAKNIMIIGAGAAGMTIVRELQHSDKTNDV
ncbi:MAG: polysaccharide biosynthesis protein, partial [Clostridiales bacterium]|nr:polysaccharide biosynthesis protein [Clostridiales bacterium]